MKERNSWEAPRSECLTGTRQVRGFLFCRSHQTAIAAIQWVIPFSNVDKRTWEIERKILLMQQYDVWNAIVSLDKHSNGSRCWKWFWCCYLNRLVRLHVASNGTLSALGYEESWVIAVSSFDSSTFLRMIDRKILRWLMDSWPKTRKFIHRHESLITLYTLRRFDCTRWAFLRRILRRPETGSLAPT